MATQSESLRNFQAYVVKIKDTDYGPKFPDEDKDYPARLDKTLQSLQNQVKELQAALEKVRSWLTQQILDFLC